MYTYTYIYIYIYTYTYIYIYICVCSSKLRSGRNHRLILWRSLNNLNWTKYPVQNLGVRYNYELDKHNQFRMLVFVKTPNWMKSHNCSFVTNNMIVTLKTKLMNWLFRRPTKDAPSSRTSDSLRNFKAKLMKLLLKAELVNLVHTLKPNLWTYYLQSISEIWFCFFGPRPWHIEIRHRVNENIHN